MTLVFDTETTGKIQKRLLAADPLQPHVVGLAAILADDAGNEFACMSVIIRPEGWEVPQEAAAIHGITTEAAAHYGIPIRAALAMFSQFCYLADELVAYNTAFDVEVMKAEYFRLDLEHYLYDEKVKCCMIKCAGILKLPNDNGYADYKWPKLGASYLHFFGEEMLDAHQAIHDTRNTLKVWNHIKTQQL